METASTSNSMSHNTDRSYHVLIGCTGSVASIKVPQLVEELLAVKLKKSLEVQVVATENALHFFNSSNLTAKLFRDEDEWSSWRTMRDPVLHVELRKWADVLVLAPLDANTLAKIVNGICDNLLTCIARAWDLKKPLLFCPAMNTHMWEHPITSLQVQALNTMGFIEVPVVKKTLACGDIGYGAMAEVANIVAEVVNALLSLPYM